MRHTIIHPLARSLNTCFTAIIISTLLITPVLAADGDLDTSFSYDGTETTQLLGIIDWGNSVAIQDDGKIVVAGVVTNGADWDIALTRYNSDGTLDSSFSGDGKVVLDPSGDNDAGYSVVIQDDGKIVLCGYIHNGLDRSLAAVRLNSNGSLDTTFDGDGYATVNLSAGEDIGQSVALQDDGKIVVAGYAYNGANYDFALARFNSDGSLDTTFASKGYLQTDFTGRTELASSLALQDDGKIVVAGRVINIPDNDVIIARYNSDGSLDTTFDSNGYLLKDLGNEEGGESVIIQDDGKIVVTGWTTNGFYYNLLVLRYNTDGSPDTTFSGNGYLVRDLTGSSDEGSDVAVLEDGKIVVSGTINNGSDDDFLVVRFNSDGSLDNTFGAGGYQQTDFQGDDDVAEGMALQDDGKIVLAGYAVTGGVRKFALARFFEDGTPPEVEGVTPAGGATDQAVGATVTAEFNEGMDDTTITDTSFTLSDTRRAAISGTVGYDDVTYTATFTPASDLDPETTYTATLSTRITDKAGNALDDDYTWSFRTGAAESGAGDEDEEAGGGSGGGLSIHGCDMGGQGNDWAWPLLAAGMIVLLARRIVGRAR